MAQASGGRLSSARLLAFAVPAGLLAGAYAFQYLGGLHPCEMCWWQRWAHIAGLALAVCALVGARRLADGGRLLVRLAALAVLVSGVIAVYHAGVELDIFEGFTQCTSGAAGGSTDDVLRRILDAPLIRCDDIPWSLWGVSMAGWNAILSVLGALMILWLSTQPSRTHR